MISKYPHELLYISDEMLLEPVIYRDDEWKSQTQSVHSPTGQLSRQSQDLTACTVYWIRHHHYIYLKSTTTYMQLFIAWPMELVFGYYRELLT